MTFRAMSGHSTTELRSGSTHVLTTVCKHKYYIKNSSDYISDYISDYERTFYHWATLWLYTRAYHGV